MRIDKFTQKMQEAVQASQDVATEFNQQEITNEHFLLALLDQAEGVATPLLEKMGVPVAQLRDRLRSEIERRARARPPRPSPWRFRRCRESENVSPDDARGIPKLPRALWPAALARGLERGWSARKYPACIPSRCDRVRIMENQSSRS